MKRVIGAAVIVVMGASALTACGEYQPTPSYICPQYGTPGQPGYHPASTPRVVTPPKTPAKPAAPKAPSLRKTLPTKKK